MSEEPEIEVIHERHFRPTHVGRLVFIVLTGGAVATLFGFEIGRFLNWIVSLITRLPAQGPPPALPIQIIASSLLGFFLGCGLGNLIFGWLERLLEKWVNKDSGDKVTIFVGVLFGFLASTPFLFFAYTLQVPRIYLPFLSIILTLLPMLLCIYVLQSMSDILPWNKTKGPGRRRGIKILDTNVIIDGRIYDVARTGFLEGNLYVPGFVLDELQYIADSHDPLRRQRGRRGLDVLRHMQSDFNLEVRTMDRLAPEIGDEVDSRLVRLARAMGADIVTNDFNLNRVAALQEVKVLNINDLALGLRPNVLPSENLTLSLVREGNQPHQGIGYLEDGTMVVVENGKPHIGETLEVLVSQVIQTERGKMIFAEVEPDAETSAHDYPRKRNGGIRKPG
jgi:uncharacterized protein YacL